MIAFLPLMLASLLGPSADTPSAPPVATAPVEEPQPIAVPGAWAMLTRAYGSMPVADKVRLSVGVGAQRRSAELVVRLAPASDPASDTALIELPPLRVYLAGARALVTHDKHPGTVHAARVPWPLGAGVLDEVTPALVLPQLALRGELSDEQEVDLGAVLGRVRFDRALAFATGQSPGVVLTGQGRTPVGVTLVQLRLSAQTGRLTHAHIELPALSADDTLELEMSVTAIEPGDPGTWAPSADRREVDRVSLLVEDRGGPVLPGVSVEPPDLPGEG